MCGNGTKVGLGIGLDGVSDTDVDNVEKARYTAVDGVELNFRGSNLIWWGLDGG